ncbi:MAG: hypothetical protein ACFFCW_08630 [Candidatus Hodarchaeota archaeon]
MKAIELNVHDECRLCQIVSSQPDEVELHDAPLLSSDNFLVVPALGQFVSGYLLIVTRDHVLNTGLLSEHLYDELESLKNEVAATLTQAFKPPIFFEHGPASRTLTGGCCIDHAHIHALPAPVDLSACLSKHFPCRPISSFAELQDVAMARIPYLYIETGPEERYVFKVGVIPRQYLRQVVCAELGLPQLWDWRRYPFHDRIRQTVDRITEVYAKSRVPGG